LRVEGGGTREKKVREEAGGKKEFISTKH